jgi:hypothetical protein
MKVSQLMLWDIHQISSIEAHRKKNLTPHNEAIHFGDRPSNRSFKHSKH